MAKLDFNALCSGGFAEQMNRVLGQVAENIQDPNTAPEKARKLTCTITFKPNQDRSWVKASFCVKPTLVPAEDIETTLVMGKDLKTGKVDITEYGTQLPGQMQMNDQGQVYDPETGEIVGNQPAAPKNIRDIRRAANN